MEISCKTSELSRQVQSLQYLDLFSLHTRSPNRKYYFLCLPRKSQNKFQSRTLAWSGRNGSNKRASCHLGSSRQITVPIVSRSKMGFLQSVHMDDRAKSEFKMDSGLFYIIISSLVVFRTWTVEKKEPSVLSKFNQNTVRWFQASFRRVLGVLGVTWRCFD